MRFADNISMLWGSAAPSAVLKLTSLAQALK